MQIIPIDRNCQIGLVPLSQQHKSVAGTFCLLKNWAYVGFFVEIVFAGLVF